MGSISGHNRFSLSSGISEPKPYDANMRTKPSVIDGKILTFSWHCHSMPLVAAEG
jgi:hypothetical protein